MNPRDGNLCAEVAVGHRWKSLVALLTSYKIPGKKEKALKIEQLEKLEEVAEKDLLDEFSLYEIGSRMDPDDTSIDRC